MVPPEEHDEQTLSYKFSGYDSRLTEPLEVSCMSTCGMIMSRALYDRLGGWPRELGIYGGGEHWMNFAGAVCGVRKWICPGVVLHHHGEKRGYNWNYTDNLRNRAIAAYLYGDVECLDRYIAHKKGKEEVKAQIRDDVIEKCAEHRKLIAAQQVCSIDEWTERWRVKPEGK
jgi:hypothetical protein